MTDVIPGRMTHDYDGDLVVYLVGMRINKPWRPDLWLPVFFAMPKMLAELSKDKDSGPARLPADLRAPADRWLVQYWNSHEKLYAYASDRDAAHRPAWTAFNRRVRKAPGAVGIWHETYLVERASIRLLRHARFGPGCGYVLGPGGTARREATERLERDRLRGCTLRQAQAQLRQVQGRCPVPTSTGSWRRCEATVAGATGLRAQRRLG